jgi:hypothetical protein
MARTVLAALALVPCVVLLLPAFAATGAIAAVAWCSRAIGRLLEPPFVPWTQLIAFDRELGWRPRPNLDTRYLADGDDIFRIVTDAEGWPGRRTIESSNIVVIGDSFAFGYGTDTHRSFAELDPRLRVKAVGAPGYSMVHGVRLMEQLGTRLRGKVVAWFVFLENDLQDNLSPELRGYRMPFLRSRQGRTWEIADEHVSPAAWRCSQLDHRRLFPTFCVPGPLADRAYSAAEYLIGRAAVACAAAGARLVLVTIPHVMQLTDAGVAELARRSGNAAAFDPACPDTRLGQTCEQYGVTLVAAREVLGSDDYKRREGIHWNQRGHRRMAELLRSIVDLEPRTDPIREAYEVSPAVEGVGAAH